MAEGISVVETRDKTNLKLSNLLLYEVSIPEHPRFSLHERLENSDKTLRENRTWVEQVENRDPTNSRNKDSDV